MNADEKRRLYVLIDRDRHYDATTICFWIAIALAGAAFAVTVSWSIWALFKFFTGAS